MLCSHANVMTVRGCEKTRRLRRASEGLDTPLDAADAVCEHLPGGFDIPEEEYYCRLTAGEIIALAESGTHCLYIGSGKGDYKDMNWDTREGIDTYCERNGDMYVFAAGGIESHPDIGVEE